MDQYPKCPVRDKTNTEESPHTMQQIGKKTPLCEWINRRTKRLLKGKRDSHHATDANCPRSTILVAGDLLADHATRTLLFLLHLPLLRSGRSRHLLTPFRSHCCRGNDKKTTEYRCYDMYTGFSSVSGMVSFHKRYEKRVRLKIAIKS